MAQATSAARRTPLAPASPPPPAPEAAGRKSPLDRIFGRVKLAARYMLKSHEELALYQTREPVDSKSRPTLATLAKQLDLDAQFASAVSLIERLYKDGWSPKGSIVAPRFKVGDMVQIREDKRVNFLRHGLYDAKVIAGVAKVEKVSGAQAAITFKGGTIIAPISANWIEKTEETED